MTAVPRDPASYSGIPVLSTVQPATGAGTEVGKDEAQLALEGFLSRLVGIGMGFKQRDDVFGARMPPERVRDLLVDELPAQGLTLSELVDEFTSRILPLCKNEASPRFMGFGDTGDDPAALAGGILGMFTQQNLINQSFDAPSATFVEIAVLRWLRELLGYVNPPVDQVSTVWDVGGVVTHGGTMSNTVAMMLARERKAPGTMQRGVVDPDRFAIVVPRGIGHYSVKSALTWIGVGGQVIEVDTVGYRYDLSALRRALSANSGRVMAVVAYAGDSRTQTVDDLRAIADLVRDVDERIWLHADACWGLVCAFSPTLADKISGIEAFDSVTVDPHKVMAIPYGLSALLVADPASLRSVSSYSDLIMQEAFAFGQVTPFVGSKGWLSLKLWMMMRAHGRTGLARMVEQRMARVRRFSALLDAHPRFLRLHEPDLAAVMFAYLPTGAEPGQVDAEELNAANRWIHQRMLDDGHWHLHQFSVPDDTGRVQAGVTLYPLRFMANNPKVRESHLVELLDYVAELGAEYERSTR
jgi:L-2,4-diaminobutyrate decarboxylase